MKKALFLDVTLPDGMLVTCHQVSETIIDLPSGATQLLVSSWQDADGCLANSPPSARYVVQAGTVDLSLEWDKCPNERLQSIWGGLLQEIDPAEIAARNAELEQLAASRWNFPPVISELERQDIEV